MYTILYLFIFIDHLRIQFVPINDLEENKPDFSLFGALLRQLENNVYPTILYIYIYCFQNLNEVYQLYI